MNNQTEIKFNEILKSIYENAEVLEGQENFFNSLIKGTDLKYIDEIEKIIYITVSTKFYKDILENNYKEIIKKATNPILGAAFEVKFLNTNDWEQLKNELEEKQKNQTIKRKNLQQIEEEDDYYENSLKSKFDFENYVVSESNKMIYSAAFNVSINPGGPWNPLFIYGGSGLGKTHVLHAIGNQSIKNLPNFRVKYIQAKDFGELVHDAIKSKNTSDSLEQIKQKYSKYNMLLIDDIQFIQNWNKAKEIFFHIFNHFIEEEKQIVITSDVYPQELGNFEQRFITRFEKGLTIGVVPPDFEGAIEIVRKKLKLIHDFDLNYIDEDSVNYLAQNFNSNVRELEGAINRVIFWSINIDDDNDSKITINKVEEIFKNQTNRKSKISIKNVVKEVSNYYNIPVEELIGNSRKKNVLLARQISIKLSRSILDSSLMEIGQFFNKNHSTIINSINKIDKVIVENNDLILVLNKIKANILK